MAAAQQKQQLTQELDPKYDHYGFPITAPGGRPGHPGHLTDAQQAQVHQLRLMLEKEGYSQRLDTLTLLRFLRARKFDVNAAKAMYTKAEQWRKGMTYNYRDAKNAPLISKKPQPNPLPADAKLSVPYNLDELVPLWDRDGSMKRELTKKYVQFYHKTDKDGRPVYIEQLGSIDIADLGNRGFDEPKMLLNLVVEYEKMADPRLPACSRKAGQLLETSCTIIDLKGVGVSSVWVVKDYVTATSDISNSYYPERLGAMYVVNAPMGFATAWGVIKNFLDPVTASKIHVCGWSYKKELLAQVPAENLPERYGGTCKCEGGCEFSDAGPWREEEWAEPAWWQKKDTIENKPAEIETAQS